MEDLLDLYAEPFSPARPVVCMDEASKQLVGEMKPSLRAAPGARSVWTTSIVETALSTSSSSCSLAEARAW